MDAQVEGSGDDAFNADFPAVVVVVFGPLLEAAIGHRTRAGPAVCE